MNRVGQRGFTVPEVLLATFVIAVGLVALAQIVPVSSYGVQEGYQLSTATFLADQKLEQVKNLPWIEWPANDCLGVSPSSTQSPRVPGGTNCKLGATTVGGGLPLNWLADEGATSITGFPGYSRTVRIVDCSSAAVCGGISDAAMRLATVTVTYTPISAGTTTAVTAKSLWVQMAVTRR